MSNYFRLADLQEFPDVYREPLVQNTQLKIDGHNQKLLGTFFYPNSGFGARTTTYITPGFSFKNVLAFPVHMSVQRTREGSSFLVPLGTLRPNSEQFFEKDARGEKLLSGNRVFAAKGDTILTESSVLFNDQRSMTVGDIVYETDARHILNSTSDINMIAIYNHLPVKVQIWHQRNNRDTLPNYPIDDMPSVDKKKTLFYIADLQAANNDGGRLVPTMFRYDGNRDGINLGDQLLFRIAGQIYTRAMTNLYVSEIHIGLIN